MKLLTCHSTFNLGVPVELFIQALTIVGVNCALPVFKIRQIFKIIQEAGI